MSPVPAILLTERRARACNLFIFASFYLVTPVERVDADVREPINVCFQGKTGKHMLALSFSQFDPKPTSTVRSHSTCGVRWRRCRGQPGQGHLPSRKTGPPVRSPDPQFHTAGIGPTETVSCGSRGRLNLKTAPRGSFAPAHIRPPCASTIERQIDSPMPMPLDLVV